MATEITDVETGLRQLEPRSVSCARLPAVVLAITTALTAAGCTAKRTVVPSALVPSDAIAMVEVSWHDVQADPLLRQFAILPRASVLLRELGVSLDQALSVVTFSRSLASDGSTDAFIVLSPIVVREFVKAADRQRLPMKASGSVRMYRDDAATDLIGLVLSDDVLAVGPSSSINEVAEVARGNAPPFLGRRDLVDLSRVFQPSEPVRMAIAWPADVREAANKALAGSAGLMKLGGFEALGSIVEKVGVGRAIGMSCSRAAAGLHAT